MKKKTVTKMQKVVCFTLAYTPFGLGAPLWRPMSAEVEARGPYDLGKGFTGFLAKNPNKPEETHVIEAESGGFVGTTIAEVRKDIENCPDITMMRKQVAKAKNEAAGATRVTADEFWKHTFK